ncbi:MAG: flagellar basal body L-ring protein FlgH [Pseudomonadota bacterium]
MMNQLLLVFGSKQGMKTQLRGPECMEGADGIIPDDVCRTTCDPRPWGLSVIKLGCLCSLAMGFLWGCAAPIRQAQPMVEQHQPHFMVAESPSTSVEGSLWQENGTMGELFINPKARRVGDIVTIKIVESSKASNNASTNTGRDSSVNVGIDKFLGLENNGFNATSGFNPFGKIAGGATTKFTGQAGTSRSGDLNAFITTRVIGVLPSGNLAISGSREIIVNNEKQLIVVTGVIRSRDISSENVVLSTFISDAKIAYSGSGIVNDQQRKGWLANIIDVISPF